ncbi:MAG: hypothetical protein C3F07_08885 [Anaerolineales bacterium]|nr:hypothetical protein [Anaerolineae bacterium]PWB73836.1 MAG: hypothetical protein C3F07_08885 [Anaerolineales bacterium]
MKDDHYYDLLKEVTDRLLTKNTNITEEMEGVKNILLSSGHDLDDVKNFKEELNKNIADFFSGLAT